MLHILHSPFVVYFFYVRVNVIGLNGGQRKEKEKAKEGDEWKGKPFLNKEDKRAFQLQRGIEIYSCFISLVNQDPTCKKFKTNI